MLETSQPNAGRLYFICPITKGYGACPFFLWYDSKENTALSVQVDESSLDGSPNSSLNGHLAIQTMNYDLDEKDGLSVEHQNVIMFESAEIDNHQLSPSINSVPLDPLENEEKALSWIEEHDDTLNMDTSTNISNLSIVLRDHHHDLVVHEGGLLNLIMDKIPQVSKQSLPAKIHCQQIEFWGGNFAAGDTLNGGGKDDVHQILGFHIFGWLGRLAFPPSECLTVPSSKPLFCCVFPSLDYILIPKEKYESYSEGLIDLPHSPSNSGFLSPPSVDEAQPLSGVLFELSGLNNLLGPSQDSVVTGTIVEALEQAALPIQNLLVTLLESINPLEHESMTWAADCTFASLDHLSVDYTHFSERVRKYISSASSFAEIERSIQNDVSSDEELMGQYHNEMDRFDTISRTHADNVEAFTTSDHRLQSLRKEASQIKEMLLQIENQISFCEAEMSELNTRVADSSEDLIESEKMLQAAAEKAKAAMEQCHQRGIIRSAAKAALEEARAQLLE